MLETYQMLLVALAIYMVGGVIMVFIAIFAGEDPDDDDEMLVKCFSIWPLMSVVAILWFAAHFTGRLATFVKDKWNAR